MRREAANRATSNCWYHSDCGYRVDGLGGATQLGGPAPSGSAVFLANTDFKPPAYESVQELYIATLKPNPITQVGTHSTAQPESLRSGSRLGPQEPRGVSLGPTSNYLNPSPSACFILSLMPTVTGNPVRSFYYARSTVRSPRKLDHSLTL